MLAISPRIETVRRLNLLFGVTAVRTEYDSDVRGLLDLCAETIGRYGIAESGDLIAITAGLPEQGLGTNLFEVHRVPPEWMVKSSAGKMARGPSKSKWMENKE